MATEANERERGQHEFESPWLFSLPVTVLLCLGAFGLAVLSAGLDLLNRIGEKGWFEAQVWPVRGLLGGLVFLIAYLATSGMYRLAIRYVRHRLSEPESQGESKNEKKT